MDLSSFDSLVVVGIRGADCSLDQGTLKKAKWQLFSKCRSSYSKLKTSIALRISDIHW